MLPLLIFGPVVAPLIVAALVFVVIAAITGTSIAATSSISTPVRVGVAFLVGGFVAAKAHSWAKNRVNDMMYSHQSTSHNTISEVRAPEPSAPSMRPMGGLPPVDIPAHLVPQ